MISSSFNLQLQFICGCNSWARPSSCVRQWDRTGRKFLEYLGPLISVRNTPFCCHLNQSEKCTFALKEEEDIWRRVHQCKIVHQCKFVHQFKIGEYFCTCAPVNFFCALRVPRRYFCSSPLGGFLFTKVHQCIIVHQWIIVHQRSTSRGDSVHFRAERLKSSASGKIAMFCRLLQFCLTYFPSHMMVMSSYMHDSWCYK